ncbi:MAG TPA: hypothetical protein VLT45_03765 [Kofleriaceae bacterium]|nr:hypothetical protein [Kofleriaceae bacterium]
MKKLGALWMITMLAVACTTQEPPSEPAPDANTCGDGKCESSETARTCPEDCGMTGPTCGNGTCETGETASSCAADCHVCGNDVCEAGEETSCPKDCPASLVVQNNSSYTVYNLYAAPCGGAWTGDQTGASYINPGASFTLTGIPPGCWSFRATTYGDAISWTAPPTTMAPDTQYTWPLGN